MILVSSPEFTLPSPVGDATRTERYANTGHTYEVTSAAISRNSKTLVS
ncbi:hypothetical protein HW132_09045 [Brasilonema sp. CT11]|nr:hypothetical protein [Brasilonema sp. CT11]